MSLTRISSLCLIAALSLLTLAAGQAQATPKWMTPPAGEPAPGEPYEASGKVEKALVLLTKVGLSTVEILCSTVKFVDALLEVSGAASGQLHYEGCTTKLNGAVAAACKPHSPGAAEGTIKTNPLKGSLKLHSLEGGAKDSLLELLPQTGSIFATLVMGKEVGSECSIGAKYDVTGTLFASDSGGELEVEAETHLLEASTALGGLKFGANAATLDGAVRVDLVELGFWSGLGE